MEIDACCMPFSLGASISITHGLDTPEKQKRGIAEATPRCKKLLGTSNASTDFPARNAQSRQAETQHGHRHAPIGHTGRSETEIGVDAVT